MRLRWVGDSRDYVKWDCVFEHAGARIIFYVPMLRNELDSNCRHQEVQKCFDQMKSLGQFEKMFPGRFDLFGFSGRDYSKADAEEYFNSVVSRLKQLHCSGSVLVFIDPDTGIEPAGGAKDEHLRGEDLKKVWDSLRSGDRLIVYQHASRNRGWKAQLVDRAAQFTATKPLVEPYFNEEIAKDVCFLVMDKT